MKEPKTPDSEKIARIVAEAMTEKLVSTGAGVCIFGGIGW